MKRGVKKSGLIGTILSISILLILMILGPNAAAATPIYGGHLLSQVTVLGNTNAVATGDESHDETFYTNPVSVTTHWTIDNQATGAADYGFYLNVTNLNTQERDDDELYIGSTAGPVYEMGTLNAEVDGSVNDRIEIYIYVNVSYGMSFDEDDATWIITLI